MTHRSVARVPAGRRAGGHRVRAHDGPGRPATSPTRWPSKPCAARWTRCPSTARSSSAKASATRRRCSTSARSSGWRRRARRAGTRSTRASRRSTSPSIRWRAPTSARPARRTRSRCSRRRRGAACCTRPTSTWRSWSSGRRRSTPSTSTRRWPTTCRPSRSASTATSTTWWSWCSTAPRHEKLIADIRATGARIRLIGDGDLSAGHRGRAWSARGVHAVMGTGGAPEGVLTAAAMRCLNGEIFARLVVRKPEDEERCRADGHHGLRSGSTRRRISRRASRSSSRRPA